MICCNNCRIQAEDCILKVNEFDLLNVPYTTAANILKSTMGSVRLVITVVEGFIVRTAQMSERDFGKSRKNNLTHTSNCGRFEV